MTKPAFRFCPAFSLNRFSRRKPIIQNLLVMKLVILLLTATMFSAHANVMAQTVTLSGKQITLEQFFAAVKKQTGFVVFGNRELFAGKQTVSVYFQDTPLREALAIALKGQPVDFTIDGKTIFISKKANIPVAQAVSPAVTTQETAVITGVVLAQDGQPLRGATVKVKETATIAVTDKAGRFSIEANQGNTLFVSYIGFQTQEIKISSTSLIITLNVSASSLDNVQIIAYGTTSRRISTGSVATVSAKEIEVQPVANPLQALSGRVPGVLITETSGTPGAGISVQIRGIGSLLSGTDPLYVVDGVPFLSEAIYSAGGNTSSYLKPAYGSSPLNTINPADIESISILKDADATAIYGSRGSNGVVLITTKKAMAGKTRVDVSASNGITGVAETHRVRPLSLSQYLEIRKTAFANSGATPTVAVAPDLLIWDTTNHEVVDFQKLLMGKTGHVTDASVSFSGGNQQTSFLLSGTYRKESAVTPGNNTYSRGAIHNSFEHSSLNRKFTATVSSSLVWDNSNNSGRVFQTSDLGGYSFTLVPNLPVYKSDGSLYWYTSSSYDNPLGQQYKQYNSKNNNLLGSVSLKYTPVSGLNVKLMSSYNRINTQSRTLNYSKGINPNTNTLPSAYFLENTTSVWNVEPQADYTTNISKGRLTVLAGTTFQGNTYDQPYYIVGTGYTSDALLTNPQAAATRTFYTFFSEYRYQSVFSRLNYNWMNKYILNVNYRWDASSRFGKNNRYGSFASAGGAWIFSEEKFMRGQRLLSYGKLRGSYGATGNDQIGNYEYMDTYSTYANAYNSVNAIVPSRISNPDLKWEVNKKMEIAIDLGFFKDRVLLAAAWFRNKTTNPLVSAPLTDVTGFTSFTDNMDAVIEQKGAEFSLNTKNIQGKNFSWTSNFNITFADSKLTSFNKIENTSYYNTRVVGRSISSLYGFHYTGLDATTRLPVFLDANKSGANLYTETYPTENGERGDYVYAGKTNPDFYGGFSNSFSYKGLQLDVFIQFVGKVTRKSIMALATNPGYSAVNMYDGVYDLFKETGGKIATRTFSYTEGTPYLSFVKYLQSDAVLSNGAYARLKNVSLSYTFNNKLVNRYRLSGAQVFVRAQNLFTVTGYKGLDPESGSSFIPPLRTITAGAKFSL